MHQLRFLILVGLAMIVLSTYSIAGSYPGDGYTPRELPEGYGTEGYGLGPDMNYLGLEFFSPHPAPDSLTDQEKYVIAGASSSDLGYALSPWYRDVIGLVNDIYFNTGEIPTELTPELIESVVILGDSPEMEIDRFRSPLTGDFPRLDAEHFSPGDMYMRLLTPEEIEYAASIWFGAYDVLVRGVWHNPRTGGEEPVYILGGVWYVRVYGYNDVLYSSVDYTTTRTDLSQIER